VHPQAVARSLLVHGDEEVFVPEAGAASLAAVLSVAQHALGAAARFMIVGFDDFGLDKNSLVHEHVSGVSPRTARWRLSRRPFVHALPD
jgi:hypothetical protein